MPPRLRPLTRDQLDPLQLQLWDTLTAMRAGSQQTDQDGALVGPFNAFMHAPELGTRLSAIGTTFRDGTVVPRRLIELAICTVAAWSQAEFVFWQHRPMAIEHGVAEDAIEDLRLGRQPEALTQDERIVCRLARQLLTAHRADDETYKQAVALLGDRGMVELTAAVGFYGMISLIVDVFEVSTPSPEPLFQAQARAGNGTGESQ